MKRYRKRTLKCLGFAVVMILLLVIITDIMTCNDLVSQMTIEGIKLEEKNSLDAIVVGASEVFAGYCPTYAWKKYGYTSFSLGLSGASCKVYKPLIAEAMKRQDCKVVAFEINGYIHQDRYADKIGKLRNVYDNLSWSMNRIQAIHENVPKEERINFYFPLLSYHSLWNQPGRIKKHWKNRYRIRKKGETYLKGFSTYSYQHDMDSMNDKREVIFTDRNREKLIELLEYCRSQGFEHVLFFAAPGGSRFKNPEDLPLIWDLVKSYGYDTLDCSGENMENAGIDIHTDFYNRDHMNVYGMEKFTEYLGKYFVDHYDINTNHDKMIEDKWDYYTEKVNKMIDECKNNIVDGVTCHYKENYFYEGSDHLSHPEEALGIHKKKNRDKKHKQKMN